MQRRLYVLAAIFILSLLVLIGTPYPHDKIIEVEYSQLTKEARHQVDCLADNIYYEAGFEPQDGRVAVALVTLNRLQDPRYPKDISSVVKQRVKSTCQFSWFCMATSTKNNKVYEEAREVALYVYANYEKIADVTHGALFYHADYVNPRWMLERTVVIGRHIFYKERI